MQNQRLVGANGLPDNLIGKIASLVDPCDTATLKNGSLVESRWTAFFQEQLFTEFRVRMPSCDDSTLVELVSDVALPVGDQDRLLRFMRTVSFGMPYDLAKPTFFPYSKVDPCHLSILLRASNITSLHFLSSTFAWFDLDDAKLDLFLRVLNLPELHEFSFFSYPGCYMPLSFFLFAPEIKVLKLEDVSPTVVNEVYDYRRSLARYIDLKDTLQVLPSCPPVLPALHCHQLALKGLGLVTNFLDFISNVTVSLVWPDGPQLTRLDLDCMDNQYLPGTEDTEDNVEPVQPVVSEVVGKLLGRLGSSLQYLRLLIESKLTPTSTKGCEVAPLLAVSLGGLVEIRSFHLVLRVNTTRVTQAGALADFARDQVLSFLRSLPRQGRDLTELDITCQFSLEDIQTPLLENDRHIYMGALQSTLFKQLDRAFEHWEYTSLRRVVVSVNFYHSDTMLGIRNSPIFESKVKFMDDEISSAIGLSWLVETKVGITTNLNWDLRLAKVSNVDVV